MYAHKLVVTEAAASTGLLSAEELRAAAGVTGSASDAALTAAGARTAAAIVAECGIAIGEGAEPTLLKETLTETYYNVCARELILSRRHNVSVASIDVDGVSLTADDYLVDGEAGLLTRLCGGCPSAWVARKIIVVYAAGFTTPPADLKAAASDMVALLWSSNGRDPLVKSESVETADIETIRRDFWIGGLPGQANSGAVPAHIAAQLSRYRNPVTM